MPAVHGLSLGEVASLLDATTHGTEAALEAAVRKVCASDLMSDVLCFGRGAQLLLTGLATTQTVRTAEISDIGAVCLVHGKQPSEDVVRLARTTGVALLCTRLSMFGACARLAAAGVEGCDA